MAGRIAALTWIRSKSAEWVGKKREKYGLGGAVLAIVGFFIVIALNTWEHIEFLAGKREGIKVVVGGVLDFVFSETFGFALMFAGAAIVVSLHFYDQRQRKRDEGESHGLISKAIGTANGSTTRIHKHVDPSGAVRQDATVSPDMIHIGANVPGPQQRDKSFTWTNMYAADRSRPHLYSLGLNLVKIGDRWSRGVICTVASPDGVEYSSSKRTPDSQGQIALLFPDHFPAPPLSDGVYSIAWRGATEDDPEVIASRDISVRQVVVSHRWKGYKPGQRLVLESIEAKQMVDSGQGRYLFEDQT